MEAHNNYVQQLHAANGMVDQYYSTTLPQLLQELDDVYQDVSAVVAETIVQGADVISMKVGQFLIVLRCTSELFMHLFQLLINLQMKVIL